MLARARCHGNWNTASEPEMSVVGGREAKVDQRDLAQALITGQGHGPRSISPNHVTLFPDCCGETKLLFSALSNKHCFTRRNLQHYITSDCKHTFRDCSDK